MKTPEPFFIIKGQQVSRTKSQENLKTLSHCPHLINIKQHDSHPLIKG